MAITLVVGPCLGRLPSTFVCAFIEDNKRLRKA